MGCFGLFRTCVGDKKRRGDPVACVFAMFGRYSEKFADFGRCQSQLMKSVTQLVLQLSKRNRGANQVSSL